MRAFSLIELIVVLVIVMVMATIAVPALTPILSQQQLEGAGEIVAAFLYEAQAEARASKRCVRVRISGTTLIADRLNTYDCDMSTTEADAPLIDSSNSTWVQFATTKLEFSMLTMGFSPVPSETTSTVLGRSEPDQIRFRPSGRLYSNDTDVTDDDGVIMITHPRMTRGNTKKILVEAQGLICVLDRGTNPGGTGNNLSCP